MTFIARYREDTPEEIRLLYLSLKFILWVQALDDKLLGKFSDLTPARFHLFFFICFHLDQKFWKELWHATKQYHRYQKEGSNFYRHLFWLMKAHLNLKPHFKRRLIPHSNTVIVKPWLINTLEDLIVILMMIGLEDHGHLYNQQNRVLHFWDWNYCQHANRLDIYNISHHLKCLPFNIDQNEERRGSYA